MRVKSKAEAKPVECHLCGQTVPSTWGFVSDIDEPDNHLAQCGKPCLAGGVPVDATSAHDKDCTSCQGTFGQEAAPRMNEVRITWNIQGHKDSGYWYGAKSVDLLQQMVDMINERNGAETHRLEWR